MIVFTVPYVRVLKWKRAFSTTSLSDEQNTELSVSKILRYIEHIDVDKSPHFPVSSFITHGDDFGPSVGPKENLGTHRCIVR